MYENISREDLEQLFHGSVVMYKGKPIQVVETGADGFVRILNIGEENQDFPAVKITDKEFNFTPVKLGFCNIDNLCYYITRRHIRQFHVGLTNRNIVLNSINGLRKPKAEERIKAINCKELRDCIMGVYPSISEAITKLKKKESEVIAVSRLFALDREHRIYLRENPIGVYDNETKKPTFFGTKSYMKILWEDLNA